MRSISSVVNWRFADCDAAPAASLALAVLAVGWRRNCAAIRMTSPCSTPVATNVAGWPLDASIDEMKG